MTRIARGVGVGFAILVLHGAAIAWLTWPLVTQVATHLPGPGTDDLLLAWVMSQETRVLTEGWAAVERSDIYHPTPNAIFYGEAGLGALPLFAPVYLLTDNPALAINTTFLGGVLLTVLALHLVVARATGSHVAGAVAAWTFLLTPWTLRWWLRKAPNYALLAYFPVVMALLARRSLSWAAVLALGLAVVGQGMVSPYLAAAVLCPVGLGMVWRLLRGPSRRDGVRLGLVLVAAVVLLGIGYTPYRWVWNANPQLESQTMYWLVGVGVSRWPAALDELLVPTAVPRPSLVLIALGVLAVLRGPRGSVPTAALWREAIVWTVLGVLLSTRYAAIGEYTIPLPLAWSTGLVPGMERLREPVRLAVLALLGLATLAGLAFDACVRRLPVGHAGWRAVVRLALGVGVGIAMLRSFTARISTPTFEERSAHFRLSMLVPSPVPRIESAFAPVLAHPGGPLLELPIGPNVHPHAQAMYRAISHRRPLVNGYHGYWPAHFLRHMELACALPDPAALAELRAATGLDLILVHVAQAAALDGQWLPPYGCAAPAPRAAWWRAAATASRPDLRLVAGTGETLLFAVAPSGSGSARD